MKKKPVDELAIIKCMIAYNGDFKSIVANEVFEYSLYKHGDIDKANKTKKKF